MGEILVIMQTTLYITLAEGIPESAVSSNQLFPMG